MEIMMNQGSFIPRENIWNVIGRCRTCKSEYIVQTNRRPKFCPVCGKELGELYVKEDKK